MPDSIVIQVTFGTGITREFYPVLHPDISVEVQAAELRRYIYQRLDVARHLSIEVRTEAGETAQQILPVAQVAAISVLTRKTASRDPAAFHVQPRHIKTSPQG